MSGSLEQTGNLTPSYGRDQESIWREIRKLWAGVNARDRGEVLDVPFTLPGGMRNSQSSRYYQRGGGRLQRIMMSLDTPGTSTTTVTIYKNGLSIVTLSLGAGFDKTSTVIDEMFVADSDYLQVGVTTAGSGASDLTVQCRFLTNK